MPLFATRAHRGDASLGSFLMQVFVQVPTAYLTEMSCQTPSGASTPRNLPAGNSLAAFNLPIQERLAEPMATPFALAATIAPAHWS